MTNLILLTLSATCLTHNVTNKTEQAYDPKYNNDKWTIFIPGDHPPTEKWVTTLVYRNDVLSFDWLGQKQSVTNSVLLSSNCVHLRVKQEWEEVK